MTRNKIPSIILSMIMSVIIIIGGVLITSINFNRTALLIETFTQDKAIIANNVLQGTLQSAQYHAEMHAILIANSTVLSELIENGKHTSIDIYLNQHKQEVNIITIGSRDGNILIRTHESCIDDILFQYRVQKALNYGIVVSDISQRNEGGLTICATAPIVNENNEIIGFVIYEYKLTNDLYIYQIKQQTGAEIIIFDKHLQINTTISELDNDNYLTLDTLQQNKITQYVLTEGKSFIVQVTINDLIYTAYYAPILNNHGEIIGKTFAGFEIDSILNEECQSQQIVIILNVFITLGSIVLVFLINSIFVGKPLEEFNTLLLNIKKIKEDIKA